jgi:hypothetical protein
MSVVRFCRACFVTTSTIPRCNHVNIVELATSALQRETYGLDDLDVAALHAANAQHMSTSYIKGLMRDTASKATVEHSSD